MDPTLACGVRTGATDKYMVLAFGVGKVNCPFCTTLNHTLRDASRNTDKAL